MRRGDPAPAPGDDPMPQPPPEPELGACCGSGCNVCVFDLYEMAMERHRKALRAWCERHPGEGPPCG